MTADDGVLTVPGRQRPSSRHSHATTGRTKYSPSRPSCHDLGQHHRPQPSDRTVENAVKRTLGSKHPNTLTSMANLASTNSSQGRRKEGQELAVEVMETRWRVSGQDHPHTLTSMGNLASTYTGRGDGRMP